MTGPSVEIEELDLEVRFVNLGRDSDIPLEMEP